MEPTAPRYRRHATRSNRTPPQDGAAALAAALRPEALSLLEAATDSDGRLPADLVRAVEHAIAATLGPLAHELVARRMRPLGGLIPAEATDADIEAIARQLTQR